MNQWDVHRKEEIKERKKKEWQGWRESGRWVWPIWKKATWWKSNAGNWQSAIFNNNMKSVWDEGMEGLERWCNCISTPFCCCKPMSPDDIFMQSRWGEGGAPTAIPSHINNCGLQCFNLQQNQLIIPFSKCKWQEGRIWLYNPAINNCLV